MLLQSFQPVAAQLSIKSALLLAESLATAPYHFSYLGSGHFQMFPDEIPFAAKDGGPFVIADYGCQDGGMSVPLIRHLIGKGDIK